MKKILISSLIAVILTFNISSSHQRVHALAWFLAPAAAPYAYAATMTAVAGAAAAGTAGMDWFGDNYDAIRDTALESWGLMSKDMQDNFMISLANAKGGLSLSADWVTNFVDSLLANESISGPADQYFGNTRVYDSGAGGFKIENGYIEQTNLTTNAKYYRNFINIFGGVKNNVGYINVSVASSGTSYDLPGFDLDEINALVKRARTNVTSMINIVNNVAKKSAYPVSYSLVDANKDIIFGLPANNVTDYIKDRFVDDAGTVVSYLPEAYTSDGVKLNIRDTDGFLVLPDGTIYTGDVTWSVPQVGIVDVAGVPTATIDTPLGKVDVITGELVVPAPITPPVDTDFTAPTKKVAWDSLIINASAVTTKFPFSIPWDLIRQLKVFDVEPETPVFKINIAEYLKLDNGDLGVIKIPMKFTVDLSMFDFVAKFIRWFNLILFDIGLILMIRKLMPE